MTLPTLESDLILVKNTESVMEITLNRPDKLNALTGAMYRDLVDLLAFAGDSDDVRAVLILGAGKSFSAGNDLADFLAAGEGTEGGAAPLSSTTQSDGSVEHVFTNGTVTVDYIDMDLDSNLLYQNGRPRVTLRQVNSTSVGNVSSNYSGIDGFFVNILISLFQGTVAGLLQDQLESFINDEFNATLDAAITNIAKASNT